MTETVALLVGLVPLLVLRVVAAAGQIGLATSDPRPRSARSEELLAAAASATSYVTGGAIVGILTTLTWWYVGRAWVPLVLALAVPTVLVLVDLVPRGLAPEPSAARRRREDRVLWAAALGLAPLLLVGRALAWVVGRGRASSVVALRRLGGWLASRPGRNPLDVSEAGLVDRIARFAAKTARDAMVPQVDICSVADTATVGEVVSLIRERGFSRLPVFHERLSNTIAVVSSHDLVGVVDPAVPVTEVMREPVFVPETKALPELLTTLQTEGRNLAFVVDEYGGFVGLVTIEDLVEEIVGEIQDEYDRPQEHYRRIAPGVFVVSARAPVTDVNERFGWNLPQGDYETVGGLVLERLGRVPKAGDGVQAGRVRLEVSRATARAVQELVVYEHRASVRRRRG